MRVLIEIFWLGISAGLFRTFLKDALLETLNKIKDEIGKFLKVPIAAAVTYGVGKAAQAYFESGMTMNEEELRREFLAGECEAKKKEWK